MNADFNARITELQQNAAACFAALEAGRGGQWPQFGEAGFDPSDIGAISSVFDREGVAQDYIKAINASDQLHTARDAAVAKLQHDIIGSMQQAVVLRGRSRISAVAICAGRRRQHGDYKMDRVYNKPIGMWASSS